MDFVTKALGSLYSGLPFTLQDEVLGPSASTTFQLHNATLKKDNSLVSVLSYQVPVDALQENATVALRKLKFPGVAKHIDSVVRDGKAYVVIERVKPFEIEKLSLNARKFVAKYVLDTLSNLETVAKCRYNALSWETVFQSSYTGLPVLIDFFYATFDEPRLVNDVATYPYPVPPGEGLKSPTLNTYQFCCFIDALLPDERRLVASLKPKSRLSIPKLASSNAASLSLSNPITGIVTDINRTLLLPPHELERLSERLVELSSDLYPNLIQFCLLPELLKSKDPSLFWAVVALVAQLGEEGRNDGLQAAISDEDPIALYIAAHFAMLDRVIRLLLLEQLPKYINIFSNKFVQLKVMPKMAFGFSDTETVVRKASVAATEFLVAKLSSAQLNSDLLRMLSKTHADSDPEIRALTTAVLCHIAPKLSSRTVVSTALSKALKDPDPRCRNAALQGVANLDVPPKEIAEKLLSSAALGMLDSDENIAADAWRVTNELLGRIQTASKANGPSMTQETSLPVNTKETSLSSSKSQTRAPVNTTGIKGTRAFGATRQDSLPSPINTQKDTEDAWGWDEQEDGAISEVDEEAWGW